MKFQDFFKARPQTATLILFGSVLIIALILILWLAGLEGVELVFRYLDNLQQNPPLWLETPMLVGQFLFFPTIGFFLIVLGITKVSPQPSHWSRVAVISILLLLVILQQT
jgi:cellulose synthase (UDP-forming)